MGISRYLQAVASSVALSLVLMTNTVSAADSLTLHVRVVDPDTQALLPSMKVKLGYWHCVLGMACAIKPLMEGVTGPNGQADLVVEKRNRLYVRVESCPGEVTMLGVPVPPEDLKQSEATVDISARVEACRAGIALIHHP
ncbi:hypothetical protein L2Y96_18965 [Luteibacter aegosomaticola]|uniref:hypothetical protein n=1 Tax=Luteibacter aegosomaticola TaxID=2911538 RepID=UPI001FF76FEB|nr:hypothetical protein [Luteibacter aegosomaticola]UPG89453.1 hypothetical protein L2Y96_18965 [Luteibacter aegosomaticola]